MSITILQKENCPLRVIVSQTITLKRQLPKNLWLLYQNIHLLKRRKQVFFVKSAEIIFCPCCNERLKVIGSRKRKYINSEGIKQILVIRRLHCVSCRKIHHELPDILVPYKRYDTESIESTLSSNINLTVAADESTIKRWKHWFKELAAYILKVIIAIKLRLNYTAVEQELSRIPSTALLGIWYFVGEEYGWLSRVVRIVVNTNSWIHTRSAFLSAR